MEKDHAKNLKSVILYASKKYEERKKDKEK